MTVPARWTPSAWFAPGPAADTATRIPRFLIRFLLLAPMLSVLAYWHGTTLVEALLPAFQAEINWLDDTYRIDRLFVDTEGADQVVRIVVGLAHCVVLPDGAHCGDPRGLANASTLAGNVALPTTLLMAIALAWPVWRLRDYAWRILILVFALPLLWALDVPFVLWSALWSLHVDMFAPNMFSPLLAWSEFLQNGGRLALACMLGVLVVGMPRAIWVRSQQRRLRVSDEQSTTNGKDSVNRKRTR